MLKHELRWAHFTVTGEKKASSYGDKNLTLDESPGLRFVVKCPAIGTKISQFAVSSKHKRVSNSSIFVSLSSIQWLGVITMLIVSSMNRSFSVP